MKKRIKITGLIPLLAATAITGNAAVSVTNVTAVQRPGTKLVDIRYDLLQSGSDLVTVAVTLSSSATLINAQSLTGDLGGVTPGSGKAILWDAGADWDGNVSEISFILTPVKFLRMKPKDSP